MPLVPFQTMDELEMHFFNHRAGVLAKAEGGFATDTPGTFNPIHGAMVWANFNAEASLFAFVPKTPWNTTGWRVAYEKALTSNTGVEVRGTPERTAGGFKNASDRGLATSATPGSNGFNNTALGGTVEGGLLADPVVPRIKTISARPKNVQYRFQVTDLHDYMVRHTNDDLYGDMGHSREFATVFAKEALNRALLKNVSSITTEQDDVQSRLDVEAVDRIISSRSERSADTVASGSATDGTGPATGKRNPWLNVINNVDNDIPFGVPPARANPDTDKEDINLYSEAADNAQIDRNANRDNFDCTVYSPTGALDSDETLTYTTFNHFLTRVRVAGNKEPNIFLGGQSTYTEVQGLFIQALRIQNPADTKEVRSVDVNGVKTFNGNGIGLHVSTINGIPFLVSKDTPSSENTDDADTGKFQYPDERDTSTTLPNIYAFDTEDPEAYGVPRFGMKILQPFVYYEASPNTAGWPYITGSLTNQGMILGKLETICKNFKTQGKIRNIRRARRG